MAASRRPRRLPSPGPAPTPASRACWTSAACCATTRRSGNKGIELDRPDLVKQHSQEVFQQAVVLKQMPLNNATGITDQERELIRRWYDAGAPAQ